MSQVKTKDKWILDLCSSSRQTETRLHLDNNVAVSAGCVNRQYLLYNVHHNSFMKWQHVRAVYCLFLSRSPVVQETVVVVYIASQHGTVNSEMTDVMSYFHETFSCVLSYLFVLLLLQQQEDEDNIIEMENWIKIFFICWQSCQRGMAEVYYVLLHASEGFVQMLSCLAVLASRRKELSNPFQGDAALLFWRHSTLQDCLLPPWSLLSQILWFC